MVHLDTDIGGDTDDACALAFLLGRPDADLTAVTTTIDDGGRRAGAAAQVLALAGRPDLPVIAGSATSCPVAQPSATRRRIGSSGRRASSLGPARPEPPSTPSPAPSRKARRSSRSGR